MSAAEPSPARRAVPNKPLPPPPSRVAQLSGRDAVHGSGAAGQRGPKAQSADADSDALSAARAEAISMHQRSGSDRSSPRAAFIPVPARSESSPDMRQGPRGGSHRALAKSPVPGQSAPAAAMSPRAELTPEEAEAALFEQLMAALQDEEALAVIEERIREAGQRQGHQGRLRSGALFSSAVRVCGSCALVGGGRSSHGYFLAAPAPLAPLTPRADNEAFRFDRYHRSAVS